MTIFYLPDLGEGLAEAVIHEWHVKIGDELKIDQVMLSVETAKALVDIPAPYQGRVQKIFAKAGDTIKTGEALIEIATEGKTATVAGKLDTSEIILPPEKSANTTNKVSDIKILPAARALAKKLNIDLSQIKGTGPQNQITVQDIQQAANNAWQPLAGVRLSMAHNMQRAQQAVVAASIFDDADVSHWTAETDITCEIIQALCKACQAEPALNAWYDDQKQARLLHQSINLGLAMDTVDGLFVPVIKQAESLDLSKLRQTIDHLKQVLTQKQLRPELFQGATISLSNIGKFAGKFATPVVLPPMVAIVAVGRIDHNTKTLPLSLSFDHRVVTGGEASRFLAALLKAIASQAISK